MAAFTGPAADSWSADDLEAALIERLPADARVLSYIQSEYDYEYEDEDGEDRTGHVPPFLRVEIHVPGRRVYFARMLPRVMVGAITPVAEHLALTAEDAPLA